MHSSRVFFAASAAAIVAALSANAKTTKMPIPILIMTSHSLQSANSAAVQPAAQGKSRVVGDGDHALRGSGGLARFGCHTDRDVVCGLVRTAAGAPTDPPVERDKR